MKRVDLEEYIGGWAALVPLGAVVWIDQLPRDARGRGARSASDAQRGPVATSDDRYALAVRP